MKKIAKNKGFTLIEILVVIGIIAVLATIVIIAINPARQFAQARNTQRTSNVETILNALGQNMADNKGVLTGCTGTIPVQALTSPPAAGAIIKSGGAVDLGPCLTPTYVPSLPSDPSLGPTAHWTSKTDYDTEYTIQQDIVANGSRLTVCAPQAILETAIKATPDPVCITR
jgi:type IV pilus assembly protein PilA